MGSYKFSGKATRDVTGIYVYGIRRFGLNLAKKYLIELDAFFDELSERSELARDASKFANNLKYYSYKAHVIFYIPEIDHSILIVRVLGKHMNFIQHL